MKIVQINCVCGNGSTGKICVELSELLTTHNIENYIFYSLGKSDHPLSENYMSFFDVKLQSLKSKVFGNYGFQAKLATKRLIKKLDKISPDIIHLHNLHSHNIHLEVLFSYLKVKKIKIYWTFHDCWAFTGYCPHYDMIGCNKWKSEGCHNCQQKKDFSWFVDRSKYLFEKKKELLADLDLTIITPSNWLANEVKRSFLKNYDVKVINNGIDLSIFKPIESKFKTDYNLEKKFVVLGVAFDWGIRKGLDVFIELSRCLDDRFKIILVGTDKNIDKQLPNNIISINRTKNQLELAEIYSAADVFVNPTREEVLGLTNIEALACGTPVITFNTGGSPECIDETCGYIVEKNDIDAMKKRIIDVCLKKEFSELNCQKKAKTFDMYKNFDKYIELYELNNNIKHKVSLLYDERIN